MGRADRGRIQSCFIGHENGQGGSQEGFSQVLFCMKTGRADPGRIKLIKFLRA